MAPVLLSRLQVDDQLWNSFIEHAQQCSIYGLSWYLDTVCDDWNALVWPSIGRYEIVMPLPIKRKWNVNVVEQPFFCQYLGIFSKSDLTATQADFFLKALSSFSYISAYSFHPSNHQVINTLLSCHRQLVFKENHTYWLSLNKSYDTVQNAYNADRKLNLKRSKNSDWKIQNSTDPEELINLFKNNHASGIRGGVNLKTYSTLYRLIAIMIDKKYAEIWYAVLNGEKCAGALFVKNDRMSVYLFNSANKIGRKNNARTFLLDEFFIQYTGNNIFFDFESPEIASIASFYTSFGGEKMPFFTIQKNALPFPMRQIQEWRKIIV